MCNNLYILFSWCQAVKQVLILLRVFPVLDISVTEHIRNLTWHLQYYYNVGKTSIVLYGIFSSNCTQLENKVQWRVRAVPAREGHSTGGPKPPFYFFIYFKFFCYGRQKINIWELSSTDSFMFVSCLFQEVPFNCLKEPLLLYF